MLRNNGNTLIETLISTAIGLILCMCCLHYIWLIMQTYNKIQDKFKLQHAKLIARHYIRTDLYNLALDVSSCTAALEYCSHNITPAIDKLISDNSIKALSSLLIIHLPIRNLVYYLRKSAVPNQKTPTYALYRDDIEHNSIALVEGIENFTVQIIPTSLTTYTVTTTIFFSHNDTLEIICTLTRPSPVMPS